MALSEHRLHILDLALAEVRAEVVRAIEKFPTFNSAHEGYAVIAEAQAAVAMLKPAILEKLHPDDCRDIDSILFRVRDALDKAQDHITSASTDIQKALDRI